MAISRKVEKGAGIKLEVKKDHLKYFIIICIVFISFFKERLVIRILMMLNLDTFER